MKANRDLLKLAAELVSIPSPSHSETEIADHIEAWLRRELLAGSPLTITRIENNVIARTELGRAQRLVIAGHIDTVPAVEGDADHLRARIEGERLYGLGACDMKGSLAAQLAAAAELNEPDIDTTFIFYEGEEVAEEHNGLRHLFAQAPDLVLGDAALLGEPTCAKVEAGCQGTLRAEVVFYGKRAHTARAWKGTNAIHRLGELLSALTRFEPRRPVIDDCEFVEAIQAVAISGGVAGNVVPDEARVTLNLRYAPDRTPDEAEAYLAEAVGECDEFRVVSHSNAAAPSLDHPLLRRLVEENDLEVAAKLGWTDVARFAAAGIGAANFGAGDPSIAHTRDEFVERKEIESVHKALISLVGG